MKLLHGDCLELMKEIKSGSIDAIICDLPYGTTKCKWDTIIPFELLWNEYNRIIKENGAIVLFGQEPFSSLLRLSNLENYKYDIYWEKERLTNINQVKKREGKTVETISVFYKKQCIYNPQMIKYDGEKRTNKVKDGKLGKLTDNSEKRVFEYIDNGTRYPTQVWKFKRDCLVSNLHPTQKPISLLEKIILASTDEGEMILDPFNGSGTTGIVANKLNRKYLGIELEKEFLDLTIRRKEHSNGEN